MLLTDRQFKSVAAIQAPRAACPEDTLKVLRSALRLYKIDGDWYSEEAMEFLHEVLAQ